MSKFFEESRKVRSGSPLEEGARRVNFQQALEAFEAPAVAEATVGSARLTQFRKIRLPRSPETPLLLQRNGYNESAMESYRALRTRLLRLKRTGGVRSVVISSSIPGEGKTLTALNLALCCAQLKDLSVLVIDGDIRTRGLTRALGSPALPGLAEVLAGEVQPEKAILATELPNLFVLGTGSSSVAPPELFANARWQEFIGWCSESFNLILVDSPPILPLSDCELISSACDGVLMVVRALRTKREWLQRAVSQMDAKKILGVVFNAVENENGNYPYYLSYKEEPAKG